MGQKKLLRFNEIKTFSNVLEYPENMKGQWKSRFENNHPITLELACGRGEYTVGLAGLFPNENFIGVDVKGNRMYLGAKKALQTPLPNAMFLRTQIERIDEYFGVDEVNEIWITFPDPQLRTSRAKKRLTHPRFLRLYKNFLKKDGVIHLKTDSPNLYEFTLSVINMYGLTLLDSSKNVYLEKKVDAKLSIKTFYESLDIAKSNLIYYLKFSLPEIIVDKDDILQDLLKNTEQAYQ